jgi:hypothetical protein
MHLTARNPGFAYWYDTAVEISTDTGQLLPDGEQGELVITTLTKEECLPAVQNQGHHSDLNAQWPAAATAPDRKSAGPK